MTGTACPADRVAPKAEEFSVVTVPANSTRLLPENEPAQVQKIGEAPALPASNKGTTSGILSWSNPIWLAPASDGNSGPVDPDPVKTALDGWSRAQSAYEAAAQKSSDACEVAKEKLAQADVTLSYIVTGTIKKSCNGKCDFGAAYAAANRLEEAAREESKKLLKSGAPGDIVLRRQLALRRATFAFLLDVALRDLKSLADPKSPHDRNRLISDVASWVAEKRDPPTYPSQLARLKPLVEGLIRESKVNPATANALRAIANDLVAACKKQAA